MRTLLTLIACVAIIGAGAGATWAIFESEPTAERTNTVRRSAMLVEVERVDAGTFRPRIRAHGVVEPIRSVTLSPRVDGAVTRIAPTFEPGVTVAEGDVLVELDGDDYRIALTDRRAALQQAEAELEIEAGRRTVARDDLALLDGTLPETNRALVLREPQQRAAEARVDAARAAVRQAELELQRTDIAAPFDALVRSRDVDLGAQVNAGAALGHLVGIDTYRIVAAVPQAHLRWLTFGDETAEDVRITHRTAWPEGTERRGRLTRSLGALEADTRMARVVIDVEDPLARTDENHGKPPLLLDAFVDVELPARALEDVVRLPRAWMRAGDTAWVMQDGELSVRELEITFLDGEYAYVAAGLRDGDAIVTTHLSTVVDGAPLRLAEGSGEGSGAP